MLPLSTNNFDSAAISYLNSFQNFVKQSVLPRYGDRAMSINPSLEKESAGNNNCYRAVSETKMEFVAPSCSNSYSTVNSYLEPHASEGIQGLSLSDTEQVKSEATLKGSDSQTSVYNSINNSLEESAIYINDSEVSPSVQNVVCSALDVLNDSSSEGTNNGYDAYFVPLDTASQTVSLELCSRNGQKGCASPADQDLVEKELASDVTSPSDAPCPLSPVTADSRMDQCYDEETSVGDIPFPGEDTDKSQPKVVVQMAPPLPACLSDMSVLKHESEDDISNDSSVVEVSREYSSITPPHRICSAIPVVDSPNRLEDSDSQQATINNSSVKVRRRFRCPPSLHCDHVGDSSTFCSFKIDNCVPSEVPNDVATVKVEAVSDEEMEQFGDLPKELSRSIMNGKSQKKPRRKSWIKTIFKQRRKAKTLQELDFQILPGRGVRLGDIPCIAAEVEDAPTDILPTFHYLLFEIVGSNKNKQHVSRTKRNILNFSGFAFTDESNRYALKKYCLRKIPCWILEEIASILFGAYPSTKSYMSEKILDFLMMPDGDKALSVRLKKKHARKIEKEGKELQRLKEMLLQGKGLVPVISVKKMTDEEIRPYLPAQPEPAQLHSDSSTEEEGEVEEEVGDCSNVTIQNKRVLEDCTAENESKKAKVISEESREYPEYLNALIQKSSVNRLGSENSLGSRQECFEGSQPPTSSKDCAHEVSGTSKTANHPSSPEKGKGRMLMSFEEVVSNISSAERGVIHLIHLLLYQSVEEIETCRKHILEFSGFTRSDRGFLDKQTDFLSLLEDYELQEICDALNLCYEEGNKEAAVQRIMKFLDAPSRSLMKSGIPALQSALPDSQGKPLRSFDNIRVNVECATPEDLEELHDVLYVRSCDSFEIHKRILDFCGFKFGMNSPEYEYRRTLMCYMDYNTVQKIARFLDLLKSHQHTHKEELAACILKFLMEPKSGNSCTNSRNNKNRAHIVMLRPTDHHGALTPPSESPSSTSCASQSFHTEGMDGPPVLEPCDTAIESHSTNKELRSAENSCAERCSSNPGNLAVQKFHNFHQVQRRFITEYSSSSEDEVDTTVPLSAFISHPSDSQLKKTIKNLVYSSLNTLTMKDLVDTVLSKYPQFDLRYRRRFIRVKARKILSTIKIPLGNPRNISHQQSSNCYVEGCSSPAESLSRSPSCPYVTMPTSIERSS